MPKTPLSLPQVRTIGLMQPMTWLVLAWRDMARAGWISFAHGLVLALFGLGLVHAVGPAGDDQDRCVIGRASENDRLGNLRHFAAQARSRLR